MSLVTQVSSLATRIGTEIKTLSGRIGTLSSLTTTEKTSLVGAVNEVAAVAAAATGIDDAVTATTTTWSSSKIDSDIDAAVAGLVASSPAALDTLDELAAALGDDANFATTTATSLGNRVRVDTAAQGLTTTQKSNARTNIDVLSSTDVGDPNTNYVTVFEAALV